MATIYGELEVVRGHVVAKVLRTSGKFDTNERFWVVGVDYQGDPENIDEALCDPLRSYATRDEAFDEIGECQDDVLGYDEFFVAKAIDCIEQPSPHILPEGCTEIEILKAKLAHAEARADDLQRDLARCSQHFVAMREEFKRARTHICKLGEKLNRARRDLRQARRLSGIERSILGNSPSPINEKMDALAAKIHRDLRAHREVQFLLRLSSVSSVELREELTKLRLRERYKAYLGQTPQNKGRMFSALYAPTTGFRAYRLRERKIMEGVQGA